MNATIALFALSISLSALACATRNDVDDTSTGADDVIGGSRVESIYSEVHGERSCRSTERGDPDLEGATEECEGAGPYRLSVWSGDMRERATVLGPEGAAFAIAPFAVVPEGLGGNTVGPKAEWRLRRAETSFPHALILRHTFGKQHYLTVTKVLGGNMCLYAIVEASRAAATANQTARDLADAAERAEECPSKISITTK